MTTANPSKLPQPQTSSLKPLAPTKLTLRNPPHSYLHLAVLSSSNSSLPPANLTSLDEITLRTHLTAALNTYLGITGTAIPIDILKVESHSGEGWVRVPRDDESAVVAALSSWAGKAGVMVRVVGRGTWLGGLLGL